MQNWREVMEKKSDKRKFLIQAKRNHQILGRKYNLRSNMEKNNNERIPLREVLESHAEFLKSLTERIERLTPLSSATVTRVSATIRSPAIAIRIA